jgi:hypothetical protein
MSADGSVHVDATGRGRATLYTTSQGLADDVQMLMVQLGARTSRHITERPPYKTLYAVGMNSAASLAVLRDARLLDVAKQSAIAASYMPTRRHHHNARVSSVVDDGMTTDVFDLEVDGVPEFSAHGIIVHNCKRFGQPGDLIPVKNHAQAQKLSKAYCACRQEKKGTIAACKVEVQEQTRTGQFGRPARRR